MESHGERAMVWAEPEDFLPAVTSKKVIIHAQWIQEEQQHIYFF